MNEKKRYFYVGNLSLNQNKCYELLQNLILSLIDETDEEKTILTFLTLYHLCDSKTFYQILHMPINHQKVKDLPHIKKLDPKNIFEYPIILNKNKNHYQYGILYEYFKRGKDSKEALRIYKRTSLLLSLTHDAILKNEVDTLEDLKSFLEKIPGYEWVFIEYLKDHPISLKKEKKS